MEDSFVRQGSLIIGLSLFIFGFVIQPVVAQEAASGLHLSISPAVQYLKIAPGESTQVEMKVENRSEQVANFRIVLGQFEVGGAEGQADITPVAPTDPVARLVNYSPSTFRLDPGAKQRIEVTFRVPNGGESGYYYALVVVPEITSATSPETASASLTANTASLFLIDGSTADTPRVVSITHFQADRRLFEFLPADFTLTVKNEGGVYVQPFGNIFVYKQKGDEVATFQVNDKGGAILPNSERSFSAEWTDGFPVYVETGETVKDKANNEVPKKALRWDFTKLGQFRFGKYTARAVVAIGDNPDGTQRPATAEVSFWVIPWRLILILLGLLLVLLVGFHALVRPMFKRQPRGRRR